MVWISGYSKRIWRILGSSGQNYKKSMGSVWTSCLAYTAKALVSMLVYLWVQNQGQINEISLITKINPKTQGFEKRTYLKSKRMSLSIEKLNMNKKSVVESSSKIYYLYSTWIVLNKYFQKQPPEITRKDLCQGLFFDKLQAGLQLY